MEYIKVLDGKIWKIAKRMVGEDSYTILGTIKTKVVAESIVEALNGNPR